MNQLISDDEVIIEARRGLGIITLNRPRALNALTLEMIRIITGTLHTWRTDESIKAVLFRGAGDRAFCAGGDLKAFHRAGMDFRKGNSSAKTPVVFFAEEYAMNRLVFQYPKPTIAVMDGITMGGGFGIAGHCAHRIVTEKSVIAMPETGIGFFPDVGSIFHLLRCQKHIGHYMAMTGLPITGADAIMAGLARYFIKCENTENIPYALENIGGDANAIEKAISGFTVAPPQPTLATHADKIDHFFRITNIHALLAVLDKDPSDWAQDTLKTLRRRAPASVMVTAAYMARAENMDFDEIIRTDFILAQRFVQRNDLYEGIRAVLIDRDNAPKWSPHDFDQITEDFVENYFTPTGYTLDDAAY
jgi:enoyl-CoA hydratase